MFISTLSLDLFSFFILHSVNNLLRKYIFVPHNFVVLSVTAQSSNCCICSDYKNTYCELNKFHSQYVHMYMIGCISTPVRRGSLVGLPTRLWAESPRVQTPGGSGNYLFFKMSRTDLRSYPSGKVVEKRG